MNDEERERKALKEECDRLYKCRDLEISNLWQRSIFLSAFLVLCFTGYAYILIKIVDTYSENSNMIQIQGSFNFIANGLSSSNSNKLLYLNMIATCLGFISSLFSTLWIMMAKGSKAWYEVYETAICNFEDIHQKNLRLPPENVMGQMGIPRKKLDHCLLSAKAGAYSPSKINIIIGQTCLIIWILITMLHLYLSFKCSTISNWWLLLIISCIIILFLIVNDLIKLGRSGHLYDKTYDDEGCNPKKNYHFKRCITIKLYNKLNKKIKRHWKRLWKTEKNKTKE